MTRRLADGSMLNFSRIKCMQKHNTDFKSCNGVILINCPFKQVVVMRLINFGSETSKRVGSFISWLT